MIVAFYIIICEIVALLLALIYRGVIVLLELMEGEFVMGLHAKSNKEVRKRKYKDQFAKTAENKKRKAEKRMKKLEKRREKKQ